MTCNTIYNEDCMETMAKMESCCIDLVVTSPPYDNIRDYKSGSGKYWGEKTWRPIIKELYRVVKDGAVVVWVVGDATVKGSETCTSFLQAIYAKEIGFNLYDTQIYHKLSYVPLTHRRYEQEFEYMFVFSKGIPKTFNPIMVKSKYGGTSTWGESTFHKTSKDETTSVGKVIVNENKQHGNVFSYIPSRIKETGGHPAPFPEQLAKDQIFTWSNEGDVIYDPFCGSGTTAKAAYMMGRKYIGSEISKEYCDIANARLSMYKQPLWIDFKKGGNDDIN